jgi:hypothetical protein
VLLILLYTLECKASALLEYKAFPRLWQKLYLIGKPKGLHSKNKGDLNEKQES